MKSLLSPAVLVSIALYIPFAYADENAETLIKSCQELVAAYEQIDELRPLGKFTTSLAEAMRAGYCLGRIDQYREEKTCKPSDAYQQAANISRMNAAGSVKNLLEISCRERG